MKRERGEKEVFIKDQEGRLKDFADNYLTPKNILASVGVASLAGLATYSTVKAFKNEKLINRIKKELNFDAIKKNISSRFNEVGSIKKASSTRNKKSEEREPAKKTQKSQSRKSKPKAKKRYVTG